MPSVLIAAQGSHSPCCWQSPVCQSFARAGEETDTAEWGELRLGQSETIAECCLVLFFLVINGKITSVGSPPPPSPYRVCVHRACAEGHKSQEKRIEDPPLWRPRGNQAASFRKGLMEQVHSLERSLLLTRFNLFYISCRTWGQNNIALGTVCVDESRALQLGTACPVCRVSCWKSSEPQVPFSHLPQGSCHCW